MFGVGDYVIYGSEGVCRVGEIGQLNLDGKKTEKEYYTLFPVYASGTKVYSPVDNKKIVMRAIISKEETNRLISEIPEMGPIEVSDERSREQAYKEVLKNCDCRELVRLIKTVYTRRQKRLSGGKKVTAIDEKYFKSAEAQLYGELAIPLELKREEVRNYIIGCIQSKKG